MPNISHNIVQIHARIREAAKKYGKNPATIQLLAVSKTQPTCALVEAYEAGQRDFGENYAQEIEQKAKNLANLNITWHFIGPIQSNKTRIIAKVSHWVHSIDRIKIAERLNQQRPAYMPPIQVCIQVNIDNQETKSGVTPCELDALVEVINQLPNLNLRGLMAIPSPHNTKQAFEQLHKLALNLNLKTLSMGMSGDMEEAIAAGSTMLRIGTAVFGSRKPVNHSQQ